MINYLVALEKDWQRKSTFYLHLEYVSYFLAETTTYMRTCWCEGVLLYLGSSHERPVPMMSEIADSLVQIRLNGLSGTSFEKDL